MALEMELRCMGFGVLETETEIKAMEARSELPNETILTKL